MPRSRSAWASVRFTVLLRPARTATMATILMLAHRMAITAPTGSLGACSSELVPGTTAFTVAASGLASTDADGTVVDGMAAFTVARDMAIAADSVVVTLTAAVLLALHSEAASMVVAGSTEAADDGN